jgi:DNA-binding NarL/FixJ family response regulator
MLNAMFADGKKVWECGDHMTSGREIYWISAEVQPAMQEKIDILKKLKVDVKVLPDFATLSRTYPTARLNTIVIDDSMIDAKNSELLGRLTAHPEYAGVRFILSITHSNNETVNRAISLGFRDVIPIDCSPELWVRRYSFASSGQAADMAEPYPQITMKKISALHIPARIAWMNDKDMWLESRLTPPVGTILTLGGGIAEFLGVNHLTLKVMAHHTTHLHFRYSDALLCRWDIAKAQQDKKALLLDFFKAQPRIAPHRIYCIIRSPELRRDLIKRLDVQRFQVSIALNKTNMIHEPRYIGPDVIIIEDSMCRGPNRAAFKEMLDNLITDIPILIVGPHVMEESFSDISSNFRLLRSPKLPANLDEYLIEQAGKTEQTQASVTFIPKNHKTSFAHIAIPARMTKLHPDAAQLAIAYPLGRFGICALDAPIFHNTLGRRVYFKVTDCQGHSQASLNEFPYKIDGLLVDIRHDERRQLKDFLVNFYQQKIEESLGSRRKTPVESKSEPILAAVEFTSQEQLATDEVSPPPARIEIDPSAEENRAIAKVDPGIWSWGPIPRELKIALWTIVGFCILYILIIVFKPSQEFLGGEFTEQLRIFQRQHSGPAREPESP